MLSIEQALQRATMLRQSTRNSRSWNAAVWAVNMAYAQGRQWSFVSHRAPGPNKIYQLREIIDPRRSDVRVMLDIIRPLVERSVAAMNPQKLTAQVIPREGSRRASIAKHVYDATMREKLSSIKALQVWRSLQWPRTVLGTMCIRRVIKHRGKTIKLPIESRRRPGTPLKMRDLSVSWARTMPWELLRSPATRDFNPSLNETAFGQEKPRTTQWVFRNFGVAVRTETTYGQMMNLHDQLIRASGWGNRNLVSGSDDKQPAVLVYEFYFQDPDEERSWPWQLIAYADSATPSEPAVLRRLHYGPNPFFGLPYHFIYYSKPTQGPWGDGMPQLLKPVQDMTNLAATTLTRTMIDQGVPKWRFMSGTVENPSKVLNNRSDMPIEWTRHTQLDLPPDRVAAASTSPLTTEILNQTQDRAMLQANMAPIQFGQQVKRGQSGDAYREVGAQADAVMVDRRVDDQLTMNELLFAYLMDVVKHTRPDKALELLKDKFPRQQIATAFSANPKRLVREVRVVADSLRPRTPRQIRENFENAAERQLITNPEAVYEMETRGGVTLNTTVAQAIQRQKLENEMLVSGQEVMVDLAEGLVGHATAIRVMEEFMSSPGRHSLSDEQADALTEHWALHKQALQALEQFSAQGAEPAGPQPGIASQPAGQPSVSQADTVESAINVA